MTRRRWSACSRASNVIFAASSARGGSEKGATVTALGYTAYGETRHRER
jgi:hypothetical protein